MTATTSTVTTIPTERSSDPAAVAKALAAHLERTWNQADGATFAAVFAGDGDFVDVRGVHHRGRPAIAAGHQGIFDGIYRGSTVRYTVDRARRVAPGCIVAVVSATLDAPEGPLQGINHARFTLTVTHDVDRWEIAAFQNTLIPRS
jgi:uncharacterized protein (TIGR02246 family)